MLTKRAAETRTFAVDFPGKLSTDELITGAPTVVEVGSSALTISSIEITDLAQTIGGRLALADQAVRFTVAGGVAGTTYALKITATTDADAVQTLIEELTLKVN